MSAVDVEQLGLRTPGWVRDTRDEARRELQAMKHAVGATLNALATNLATKSRNDDVASIEEIQEAAQDFLGTVRRLTTRVCDRLSEGLHERLQPLIDLTSLGVGDVARAIHGELARWETSIRLQEATHTHYVSGWIDGGGLALTLMLELPPGQTAAAPAYKEVLQQRLAFDVDRAEAAVAMWLDEVDRGLTELVPLLETMLAKAPPTPAPRESIAQQRLSHLLERAAALEVRIRNPPEEPTDRYLDKLQAQLDQLERKHAARRVAATARRARLDDLMRFASSLNVRPKDIPGDPSDAWLDRMEAKLVEVAGQRNVPLPSSIEPPTAVESHKTLLPPPEREMSPDNRTSVRVQSLIDRAHSVGLDLGRIPERPSEAWVADMEARLQQALEERRSRRLEMRQRRKTEQDVRLERIQAQSRELGVQLGPVPTPLTEEWLTGAELAMASALMESEASRRPSAPPQDLRAEVNAVVNAASAAGVDLGIIPQHPDQVWLTWARARVSGARSREERVSVVSEGSDTPAAYLVYQEGTVQEQQWPVGRDAITIGRSRGNDVQIQNDPSVSRRHASLQVRQGTFTIADLGSTKGTVVDSHMITAEQPLYDGARIQVGETDFVFRLRAR